MTDKSEIEFNTITTVLRETGRLICWQNADRTWRVGVYTDNGKKYEWASGVKLLEALNRLFDPVRPRAPKAKENFEDLA